MTDPEPTSWQAFHGVSGELIGAHHDEDGVMIRADFHGSKLSASGARELARHLEACADLADNWMAAAVTGSTDPREYGEYEPEWPKPECPCPETSDGQHADDWHDGGKCMACGQTGPEPEPEESPTEDYDPGPEVDDMGGMSEYRYHEPEPWQ